MQEPVVEGVNPTHFLQLWENTWRLLWDAVKIYLAATCHSKSAPCHGPGDSDFGSMGPRQRYPWVPPFHLPPKKPNNGIVLFVKVMLLNLSMHWWMSCKITSSGTSADASIIKNRSPLWEVRRTGWLPALVGWRLTGPLPCYHCDSLLWGPL